MSDLAVTRLSLACFRSYQQSEILPSASSIVLYGANGSGKTNILEALSLLTPGRGLRRAGTDEFANVSGDIGWRLKADIATQGDQQHIQTGATPGQARHILINEKNATGPALGRLMRAIWLIPAMDRLWADGASERRRFIDRITLGFFADHASHSLAYEKAMRARNRLLKEGPNDPAWFDALELQMAEHGAAIMRARQDTLDAIMEAQHGASSAFPTAHLALIFDPNQPALADDKDGLAAQIKASRAADMAAGRTLVGPHRCDLEARYLAKDMQARQCSTGEQKALLISILLAAARAMQARAVAPLLLLDEVAAHFDPDRRAQLFDEIETLNIQAWMTGTDRSLFTHLEGRACFYEVGMGATGSSEIHQK